MPRPKILVIAGKYWTEGRGAGLATHKIVGLLKEFAEVTVITGTRNPEIYRGVKYVYEPLLGDYRKPILWINCLRLKRKHYFKKFVQWSDVVYITRFEYPLIPYCKKMKKKVVLHFHDYMPATYTSRILAPYEEHKNRIKQDDILMEYAKGVKYATFATLLWQLIKLGQKWITEIDEGICVSKRQAEILSDMLPYIKNKLNVIYNPLPENSNQKFNKCIREPTFLYVGGERYYKGFYVILNVLMNFKRIHEKMNFFFTDNYSRSALNLLDRIKAKRGLQIRVLGKLKYDQLVKLHESAWALIFPSIWEEPLPYAVLEAMIFGTIPIASRVGGVSEIVNKTPAEDFTFPVNDTITFVDKIEKVLALSKEEIEEIILRQKELISKKFKIDVIRGKLKKLME